MEVMVKGHLRRGKDKQGFINWHDWKIVRNNLSLFVASTIINNNKWQRRREVLTDSDVVCSFNRLYCSNACTVIAADDWWCQLVGGPGGKDPPCPLHGVSDQLGGPALLFHLQQVWDLLQPKQPDLRAGHQVGNFPQRKREISSSYLGTSRYGPINTILGPCACVMRCIALRLGHNWSAVFLIAVPTFYHLTAYLAQNWMFLQDNIPCNASTIQESLNYNNSILLFFCLSNNKQLD